jgi:hypothetical protein
MGIIMFLVGPSNLLSYGIAEIEGAWGQFVATDKQNSSGIDVSIFFRVFSIFIDHQTFSGFLQLSSLYYRYMYEKNSKTLFIYLVILNILANLLTFSTTGLVVLLLILLSFYKIRYSIIFLFIFLFLFFYLYIAYPDFLFIFFHIGSLEWRIEYLRRILDIIEIFPSLDNMGIVNFTSDSYLFWMSYRYGWIFFILFLSTLITYFFLLIKSNSYRLKFIVILFMVVLINFLTNNIFYSTPNNILFPLLLGVFYKTKKRGTLCKKYL